MTARLARSLETLLREVNARYPGRSTASDGWIGNPAHAATPSDHNPNAHGVVCALDITNDPDHGVGSTQLGEFLRLHPHPDVKYVIDHPVRRMWSRYPAHGVDPFTWRDYTGPEASELHVSVGVGRDGQSEQPYDDEVSWFADNTVPSPIPQQPSTPEEDQVRFTYVMREGGVQVCALFSDAIILPVVSFDDIEEVFERTLGATRVTYGTTVDITDGNGTTRPVWPVGKVFADQLELGK